METTMMRSAFSGSVQQLGKSNGSRVQMKKTGTKTIKKAQGTAKSTAKKVQSKVGSAIKRAGRQQGDALWLPNTTRPAWLDGTLPGDRGFDPLGLAKPTEYLQVGLDELDQNKAVNKAGTIIGSFKPTVDKVSTDALQPYSEVFGLQRFRETELIHGRWCMLATLGVVVAEATTGVSWVDAGKVELDGAQYLGFGLPFTITQLVWIEAILVGGAEIYRNTELDPQKRIYPGGVFDPLGLASGDRAFALKTAEIKHGRLAMIAFLGFGVQALTTGKGALGSLASFANSFEKAVLE